MISVRVSAQRSRIIGFPPLRWWRWSLAVNFVVYFVVILFCVCLCIHTLHFPPPRCQLEVRRLWECLRWEFAFFNLFPVVYFVRRGGKFAPKWWQTLRPVVVSWESGSQWWVGIFQWFYLTGSIEIAVSPLNLFLFSLYNFWNLRRHYSCRHEIMWEWIIRITSSWWNNISVGKNLILNKGIHILI